MPPKKNNNKPKADNKPQQKSKDAFTPTPAPVQQQSGMSYMSALKTKEAAAQQAQAPAPVVAQVVAPAPAAKQQEKPATPAKQQQPAAQASPAAKQQEPAASTGFSYKSALQKPAAPKPAPVAVPQQAEQKPAVVAPAVSAEKPKKDEAAPVSAEAQSVDAESPVSPQQQGFKKVRSNKPNDKSKLKFNEKLNIPPGAAAYIIGRGGANVKRINETSGARVTVKDAHVSIQANLKQQFTNAKRQVLELLKAYLTRVQTQAREFNIIMPEDSDSDALKLCMNQHEGPLSEWIVRDATPKQKEQPKKEAAPAAEGAEKPAEESPATPAAPEEDTKPVFYTTSVIVDKSLEQEEEEVDEETDTLNRMVEYTSGSKKDDKDRDSEKPIQGASISLISKSVLNETFSSFAEKLAEEHEREEHFRSAFKETEEEENEEKPKVDEKKKEHNKNSIDAEVNIGKKLFYINPEAKKKRKNKEKSAALDKVEDVPLATFLDYKFGYSHKFHMAFNYALSAEDIAKIEGSLKSDASFKLEKKQTLSARVILGFKKANVTFTVEPSEGNLASVKIADYYEKSSRFSLIDFLRPKQGVLDFRIIGRYYSKVEAPQQIVDLIAKRVRFDKEKNELVVAAEEAAPVAADAEKKAEEKKPERFNVYLDRVKGETLYSNGKFTVILSQVKDIVKEKNAKKEGEQQAEGKQEEQQHEEEDAKAEKKIVESLEASVRCAGLRYEGVTTMEQALSDTRATMEFITTLLERVSL